jgi:protein-disulfide isomerase
MKKYWIVLMVAAVVVAIAAYKYARRDQMVGEEVVVMQPGGGGTQAPASQTPKANLPNAGYPFLDTSILKPPAGAKVAIYEFEDLECPACARAYPIVHAAAAQYKIPVVRHDYPWFFHVWSFDAAVTARYIQDKISPQLADEFRRDVFANQTLIASKDDLGRFTTKWFQEHGKTMPFVIDPDGACKQEVEADHALGDRLGVHSTPCIFVVTQSKWVQVNDVSQLDRMVEAAIADKGAVSANPAAPMPWSQMLRTAA